MINKHDRISFCVFNLFHSPAISSFHIHLFINVIVIAIIIVIIIILYFFSLVFFSLQHKRNKRSERVRKFSVIIK